MGDRCNDVDYVDVDIIKRPLYGYRKSLLIPGVALLIQIFHLAYTHSVIFQDSECVHGL